MSIVLSPSIMVADLLNIEKEIKLLEEANADLIHFDVMDTTFTDTTMLPPIMIPKINEITDIPVDIHIMIDRPERVIDYLLPYCDGNYMTFHIESSHRVAGLIKKARNAGAKKVGVALNYTTPLCNIENLLSQIDIVLIILGEGGIGPSLAFDDTLLNKVKNTRELLDKAGNSNAMIAVDGGVSFEVAKKTYKAGAEIFVLGTSSIYKKDESVVDKCNEFREYLQS